MPERLLREPVARARIGIGKTVFYKDVAPQLVKVRISERAVGYTETSVDQYIQMLIEKSTSIPPITMEPNRPERRAARRQKASAGLPPMRKKKRSKRREQATS